MLETPMLPPPVQPPPQQGYSPNYAAPPADNPISTLIPYKNGFALAAYYVGVFSVLPLIGAVMGPVAVVLGVKGLMAAKRNPGAKGAVHAWVGIICGALFGLAWLGLGVIIVIGLVASRAHR